MSEFTRRGGEQLFSPLSLSVLLTVFHDRYVDTDSVENKQKEGQTLLGWMAGNRNLGSSAVPRKKRRCHEQISDLQMRQLGGRDGDSGEKNETAPLLVSSECFLPVGEK
jgi:hypothetical protein